SRAFIEALEISGYFDAKMHVESEEDVIRMIDEEQAKVGIVIPPDFATRVERGDAQVLIVFDGSESLAVQTGYSAASTIAQAYSVELLMGKAGQMGPALGVFGGGALPINTSIRVLYNPDMDGLVFMVPGIAAILLQLLTIGQVSMVVVRERELGTLEQLLITPVRPLELIISKVMPNIILTIADTVLIVLIGVVWFGVPFRGSVGLFAWLSLLFIISGLGLGLLISTVSQTQKQAQQITAVLVVLTTMLTGLFYPRLTMPPVVQAVGNLIPVTYFIRIARGIITKGIGLSFMWRDVVILAIYAIVVIVLASLTFRKRLD
ncbi:MAG: ABC transporter permease, partial [Anaerolineae bacterium]